MFPLLALGVVFAFVVLNRSSDSSSGGGLHRPQNVLMDPGQFYDNRPHSSKWRPISPDQDPGSAFFEFVPPDTYADRQAYAEGELVTSVLAGDPTQDTEGREPLVLAYFRVAKKDVSGYPVVRYDLDYLGVGNMNSDTAMESVALPPRDFQLTGIDSSLVAQGIKGGV